MYKSKSIIGWREWCALPALNLPAVLAKVDTGAKTSSLHAFQVHPFDRDGKEWVQFTVHPIQRHRHPEILAEAPVLEQRTVTSSNGESEQRFVIVTTMVLGHIRFDTELTLSNRDEMGFRMLIGRQSLAKRFVVDSALSFTLGDNDLTKIYPDLNEEH